MVYPQFKCADSEPAIATSKHEDAHGLEYQRGAILVGTSFFFGNHYCIRYLILDCSSPLGRIRCC
jgi:hypothetical protein